MGLLLKAAILNIPILSASEKHIRCLETDVYKFLMFIIALVRKAHTMFGNLIATVRAIEDCYVRKAHTMFGNSSYLHILPLIP